MKKMTPQEFMDKCVWEGGDLLAGLQYGLNSDDVDDSIPEFKRLVNECHKKFCEYRLIEDSFDNLCDRLGLEWDR